jgi:hypothetical protein
MNAQQLITGLNDMADHLYAPKPETPLSEILMEIRSRLASAEAQTLPTDDRIIAGHVATCRALADVAWSISTKQPEALSVLKALMDRYDPEDAGAAMAPDGGCIECTSGQVPNNLNTGLCPLHRAERLFAKA